MIGGHEVVALGDNSSHTPLAPAFLEEPQGCSMERVYRSGETRLAWCTYAHRAIHERGRGEAECITLGLS